ncbi:MAG: DUF5989 family protein [Candidatus Calescibacterium sp.]|nr:DUF5989 family protein [Candidatus Calescibacterium sp.]MCX7733711.1 DUF5989 family protein [bacterium]MDW8087505.1 DUF5989 family protein [Candidatus Calescibacterium sp.]
MISFVKEFIGFVLKRKKLLLIPFVFVLIILGFLIFLGSSTAISPFIYTLF